MPAVPRSTACQLCKQRRIQCDRQWPICTACKRKGHDCPGPSNLTKFINYSHNANANSSRAEILTRTTTNILVDNDHQTHQLHLSPIKSKSSKASRLPHGSLAKFRLRAVIPDPTSVPTSLEDHIALRFISYITKDAHLDTKKYFKFIPSRLASSISLRDSVNLFCSTVTNYKFRLPSDHSETIIDYGKALNSLRRTLQGEQASKLETLASIALLGRAEEFFDPEWKPFRKVHSEGIMILTQKLGPPGLDDEYGIGIFFDNYEPLMHHFMITGTECFFALPEWRRLEEAGLRFIKPELRPYCPEVMAALNTYTFGVPKFLRKIRAVRSNPYAPDSVLLGKKLMAVLLEAEKEGRNLFDATIGKGIEFGEINIFANPDSLTGKSYKIPVGFFSRLILNLATVLVGMARIQYDLRVLYDVPNSQSFFARYRDLCMNVWMFIPLLIDIERIMVSRVLTPLALSYEGAGEEEKEVLIDRVIELNIHCRRLPSDRDKLAAELILEAQLLTGRSSL